MAMIKEYGQLIVYGGLRHSKVWMQVFIDLYDLEGIPRPCSTLSQSYAAISFLMLYANRSQSMLQV
jgi:hypothetical protein